MDNLIENIEFSKVLNLKDLISYQRGQIIIKTIVQTPSTNITLFALDKGEGITTNVAFGDAIFQILDGVAEARIGNDIFTVKEGETIVMPSDIPHGIEAIERFKMLLTVIKH
jgi:quercetin dioxygenase-like cupin family protein